MKLGKILIIVLVVVAFIAGRYMGRIDSTTSTNINDSSVSYQGGFKNDKTVSATKTVIAEIEEGETIDVKPGDLIMDAVKRAKPGDTIRVYPGTYSETVYIDKDHIRLIGVVQEGKRATLDGNGHLNDAILYSGNNIVIENFLITRYKGNGVMGQAGNNFEIRNNLIHDTGVYGIFPQLGQNGIVEHNIISGIADAAIYIGMSDNVVVAHNDVYDSVAGIEIENSRHCIVENNFVHENTGGILAFVTPGLPVKDTVDVIIRNNWVHNNNTKNFGAPGSTVSGIPAGTGVLIMAADDVIVEDNIITSNKTAGIIVTDHYNASNITIDPESDPYSDRVKILNNLMDNNGYDTIDDVKALMLTEFKQGNPDIISVGKTEGSCIINRHRYITAGVSDWAECDFTNTDSITTYLLEEPVPPRVIDKSEVGKYAYLGICTGCHTYTGTLIGPPVVVIQALYQNNPEGLAEYIKNPVKKRPDYPEMPPQDYLDEETRMAVAKYMLQAKN